MAKFDDLRETIDALDKFSSDDKYKEAFNDILDAIKHADDEDVSDLADIVAEFHDKLPGDLTLNRIRAEVKELDEDLTLDSIDEILNGISNRNKAIKNLTDALDKESKKAVKDANLLSQIKDAVDKATKTVTEVRTLVDKLTESDANAKSDLIAFINALDNISSIFKPQTA